LFDQEANGITSPKCKGKLQLIWCLVDDQTLDFSFQFSAQFTLFSLAATTFAFGYLTCSAFLVACPNSAAMGFSEANDVGNFLVRTTGLA